MRAMTKAALVVAGLVPGLSLLPAMSPAWADGTETLGPPSVTLAEGSGIAMGGTGLFVQPSTFTVTVPDDATVKQVLLYYEAGHHPGDTSGSEPAKTIVVNGTQVSAEVIGGPTPFYGDVITSTHRLDVTAMNLVHAGTSTITVDGLDTDEVTDGAGVVVVYDEPGKASQLRLVDGNDIAFVNFAPPLDAAVPQTFTFDPADVERTAQLSLMVTSVHDPVPDGMPNPSGVPTHRPHALRYTVGGVTTTVDYPFVDDSRRELDFRTLDVTIPAGATTLTVEPLSVPDGSGDLPASIVWLNAALAVPLPVAVVPVTPPPTTPPPAPPTPPVTEAPTAVEAAQVQAARGEIPVTGRRVAVPVALGLTFVVLGLGAVGLGRRRWAT